MEDLNNALHLWLKRENQRENSGTRNTVDKTVNEINDDQGCLLQPKPWLEDVRKWEPKGDSDAGGSLIISPKATQVSSSTTSSTTRDANHCHVEKHGESPFACRYCSKRFKDRFLKFKHEQSHGVNIKFACDFCPFKFTSKGDLETHVNAQHSKEREQRFKDGPPLKPVKLPKKDWKPPFTCYFCDKEFDTYEKNRLHEISHTHPYRCKICATRKECKDLMAVHESFHRRKLKCKVCQQEFTHLQVRSTFQIAQEDHVCGSCKKKGFGIMSAKPNGLRSFSRISQF